ncbi:MAG TPA: hypothetical protein P5509_07255 [Bacteroidales bacterium]|nr:hypothetical protein [Bacteroidales bacterium]
MKKQEISFNQEKENLEVQELLDKVKARWDFKDNFNPEEIVSKMKKAGKTHSDIIETLNLLT